MANQILNVPVIEKEFENQLITKLNIDQFLKLDDTLTKNEGDTVTVVRYEGLNGVEALEMGSGNTETMEVKKTSHDYKVKCFQGRFPYYEEEFMTDSAAIEKGIAYMNEAMVNKMNSLAIEEFLKSKNTLKNATWTYDNIVDACAKLNHESTDGFFMLISPAQEAAFKKSLKNELNYVEAFIRYGYIGNINNLPIYVTKAVPDGKAIIANGNAVTLFLKAGTSYESERDANTRKNTMYIRKYGVVALTDESYCVVLDSAAG